LNDGRFAVRLNWYGSKGNKQPALMFRFTSRCQRVGVEPLGYLQGVLPPLSVLWPDRWQAARRAKMATPPSPATDASTPLAESAYSPLAKPAQAATRSAGRPRVVGENHCNRSSQEIFSPVRVAAEARGAPSWERWFRLYKPRDPADLAL
jgi:hypothetical protein